MTRSYAQGTHARPAILVEAAPDSRPRGFSEGGRDTQPRGHNLLHRFQVSEQPITRVL